MYNNSDSLVSNYKTQGPIIQYNQARTNWEIFVSILVIIDLAVHGIELEIAEFLHIFYF